MMARRSTDRTIHELAVTLAMVHRALRQWMRHSRALNGLLVEYGNEREAYRLENVRLSGVIEDLILTTPRQGREKLRELVKQRMEREQ
jgi:hypothetical protein